MRTQGGTRNARNGKMAESALNALAHQILSLPENALIYVLPHERADGDALGSGIALWALLEKAGLNARLFLDEKAQDLYAFMGNLEAAEIYDPRKSYEDGHFFLIDAHSVDRLGKRAELLRGREVDFCIDHHLLQREMRKNEWIDSSRSSTGEMIGFLMMEMEKLLDRTLIDPEIASFLTMAIYADTGGLRYSNTGADTYRMMAYLMQVKPPIDKIAAGLFSQMALTRLRAKGRAFSKAEWLAGGKLALCVFERGDFLQTGSADEDLEGICSELREVRGTELAIFIRIPKEGDPRVNLRSGEDINAQALAAEFGGGGHARAAGCSLEGEDPIQDRIRCFVNRALEYVGADPKEEKSLFSETELFHTEQAAR